MFYHTSLNLLNCASISETLQKDFIFGLENIPRVNNRGRQVEAYT